MKKIETICIGITLLLTLFPVINAGVQIRNQKMFFDEAISSHQNIIYKDKTVVTNSEDRPFHLSTFGLTKIKGNRYTYFTILGMKQPWPDQTYSALFGYINYKNGNTTIHNKNTDETIHRNGEHIVMFYKFYGPTFRYHKAAPTFEGDTVFAMVIGGQ